MDHKTKQQRVRELQREQKRQREEFDHVLTPDEVRRELGDIEWMKRESKETDDR